MIFSWNRGLGLLAITFLAGGCTRQNNGGAAQGIAASWVAGRTFEATKAAVRRGDGAQIRRAGAQMQRATDASSNPQLIRPLVSELILDAGLLDAQSVGVSGDEKYRFSEQSNARYRAALAFTPAKSPEKALDAPTLNALGYFLADKGTSRADFERAAILTRAAYRKWDMSGRTSAANAVSRATGPQDSYAWALFKLGKYEQAREQQEAAWDIARGMGTSDLNADIPFHLGEIYRATGQLKKARETYESALTIASSKEMRVLLESRLESLSIARV